MMKRISSRQSFISSVCVQYYVKIHNQAIIEASDDETFAYIYQRPEI